MNNRLITLQQLREYKQISQSCNKDILNQYILDAQIQDLAPLLGEDLFNDLVLNPDKHSELLYGGNYEVNGITYINVGLNCVLAHYTYARYTMFGSMVDTPFGQVEKVNQGYSQPTSNEIKENIYKMNQKTAFTYFGSVEKFLNRTNYPMWNVNRCKPRKGSFRISKIG